MEEGNDFQKLKQIVNQLVETIEEMPPVALNLSLNQYDQLSILVIIKMLIDLVEKEKT